MSCPWSCSTLIHLQMVSTSINLRPRRQINSLEPDLVEKGQFTFGPPPTPSFFPARPVANRLGGRIDSRGSSKRSRSRQLGLTPMEGDEMESSTPQCSGTSRYLERVKDLDMEDLACRLELLEVWELKSLSHEDLSNHYCADWLKAHEARFLETKPWRRRT